MWPFFTGAGSACVRSVLLLKPAGPSHNQATREGGWNLGTGGGAALVIVDRRIQHKIANKIRLQQSSTSHLERYDNDIENFDHEVSNLNDKAHPQSILRISR